MKVCLYRNLYTDVYSDIIPNNQKIETIQISFVDEWIKKLWYTYTMEYYSALKRNTFESVLMRWMNLEPIIQNEVSQKIAGEMKIRLFSPMLT